ncbi:MAG TPA: tetratricopeptide repeat protein [Trichormus sp.]
MEERRMQETLSTSLLTAAQQMLNFAAVEESQAVRKIRIGQMLEANRADASSLLTASTHADLQSIHRLGVAYRLCNEYAMAERFYLRAVDLALENFGTDSLETAKHRNFLAGLYFAAERFDLCKNQLEESLRVYESALGAKHVYAQLTRFALALTYRSLGNKDKSSSYLGQSDLKNMAEDPYAYQPANRWTALLPKVASIAAIKFEQGLYQESIELFRFCVLQEANEAWPGSLILARSLSDLSILCRSQGLSKHGADFAEMAAQIRATVS